MAHFAELPPNTSVQSIRFIGHDIRQTLQFYNPIIQSFKLSH